MSKDAIKAKDVPPKAYFVEERRMPGTSTHEGELRVNFFKRTPRKSTVMVNGMECIKVLSYGFTQGDSINRVSRKGTACRLIASVPVFVKKKKKKKKKKTSQPVNGRS